MSGWKYVFNDILLPRVSTTSLEDLNTKAIENTVADEKPKPGGYEFIKNFYVVLIIAFFFAQMTITYVFFKKSRQIKEIGKLPKIFLILINISAIANIFGSAYNRWFEDEEPGKEFKKNDYSSYMIINVGYSILIYLPQIFLYWLWIRLFRVQV